MKPVVVLDLDDTLYPERDFVASGFRAVDVWLRDEAGVEGFARLAGDIFAQGRRGRIFDEALVGLGVDASRARVEQMIAVYRAHRPVLALYPDARRALAAWREHAWLGVITDGHALAQRQKIAALGLDLLVDEIICTDELGRECWKPHPAAFMRLMRRFSASGSTCVYCGDNPHKDFLAPNQLGWLTVRVRRPGGEHATAEAGREAVWQPQRTIRSFDELGDGVSWIHEREAALR